MDRQGTIKTGSDQRKRTYEGPMTDVLYLLITLAAFAGLALLVGALDR